MLKVAISEESSGKFFSNARRENQ